MFSTIRNTLFQDKFKGFISLFHTIFAPFSTTPFNASPYVLLYPSFSIPLESFMLLVNRNQSER